MTPIPPPFDSLWFLLVIGGVIGLAFGSFVTMLSYRLPRGLSIVAPGSQCPSCRTMLRPLDLVPVASWVMFGGKCRHCGSGIGLRYVLIELVTALLVVAAFAVIGFVWLILAALAAIIFAVTAAVIWWERRTG